MTARTVTISDADVRELEWLRGGIHALAVFVRFIDRALEHGDLKSDGGMTDAAGMLTLVAAIEACDTIDRLLTAAEQEDAL